MAPPSVCAIREHTKCAEEHSPELLRLLAAVDCIPRGGLYNGYYALCATLRYERIWIPLLRDKGGAFTPPLDVQFAWFVHRQDPLLYEKSMDRAKNSTAAHPLMTQAFAFGATRPEDRAAWASSAGDAECPVWPPPPPGSSHDPTIALGATHTHPGPHAASHAHMFAVQLAALLPRLAWQLRSWLRPAYLDPSFLARAEGRYARFLALHATHPQQLLVPAADIGLMWHTHLGLSGQYAAACRELFGPCLALYGLEPVWRPDYLDLTVERLEAEYGKTADLYEAMFGEPYDDPDTAWLPLNALHPFADPATSPLAFGLRALDRLPSPAPGSADAASQRAALAAARRAAAGVCPAAASAIFPAGSIDVPGLDDIAIELQQQQSAGLGAGNMGSGSAAGVPVNKCFLPSDAVNFGLLGMSGVGPACGGGVAGGGGGGCPRAGAHGLFVVWLGSSRAEEFFSRETCKGMCLAGSWSIRVSTIERMTRALAGQMQFRETPAYHTHPFLLAFTPRAGLWFPRRVSAAGVLQRQLMAQAQAHAQAAAAGASTVSSDCNPGASGRTTATATPPPPAPCNFGMFSGQPPSLPEAEAYLHDPRGVMAGITAVIQLTTAPQRVPPPAGDAAGGAAAGGAAAGGTRGAGGDSSAGGMWRKLVQGLRRGSGSGGRRSRRAAPLPSGSTHAGAGADAEECGPNTIGGAAGGAVAGPVAEGVRSAAAAAARAEPAPLWSILRRPMYANRAVQFFDYLRRRAATHAGAAGGAASGDEEGGSDLAAAQRRLAQQKSTSVTDGRARGRGGRSAVAAAPADAYTREVLKRAGGGVKEADCALAALRRDFVVYGAGM